MEIRTDLSLRQELKITTQLLQTMEILQLSNEELSEKIKKESENNPTISLKESPAMSYSQYSDEYRRHSDRYESYSDSSNYGSDLTGEEKEDTNWFENTRSSSETLQEHLIGQLGLVGLNEEEKKAAETIITSLDRFGFTGENPESLLPEGERKHFERAIKAIQEMEPTGVGAKNWREALMLQIKEKGAKEDEIELFRKLIYSQLENIKAGKLEAVARELKTDTEDVSSMLSILKTLNPYPGLKYSGEWDEYIIPELSIKKEDGKLLMKLNRDNIPLIEIDPSYKEMEESLKASKSQKDKEALKYLKEKLSSASSLISLVNLRENTLEKTGIVLMEKQKDFFLYGPLYLKGLTMKDVADEIGVHEATVSRIASSKYIDTDFGIVPIKYLFSNQMSSESNVGASKNAIKEMIRIIISENKSGKPLSDQKISDMLKEKGISAARRTVAKYRSELMIDSSFQRNK